MAQVKSERCPFSFIFGILQVKDYEDIQKPPVNSMIIGAYRANTDTHLSNQRVFSANIPMSNFENLQNRKRERLQYESINLQLIKQLSQIRSPQMRKENQENEFSSEEIISIEKPNKTGLRTSSPAHKHYTNGQMNNEETMVAFSRLHDYSPLQNAPDILNVNDLANGSMQISDVDLQSSTAVVNNSDFFDKPYMQRQIRKNVSFSQDIDVRTFQGNITSTLPKLKDLSNKSAFLMDHLIDQKAVEQPKSILIIKGIDAPDASSSDFHMRDTSKESLKVPNEYHQRSLQESFSSMVGSSEHLDGRKIASSDRKLPGETPVKDLERTLKMAIIKEISVEKIDGKICCYFAIYSF
jgi:hypothetical protein